MRKKIQENHDREETVYQIKILLNCNVKKIFIRTLRLTFTANRKRKLQIFQGNFQRFRQLSCQFML